MTKNQCPSSMCDAHIEGAILVCWVFHATFKAISASGILHSYVGQQCKNPRQYQQTKCPSNLVLLGFASIWTPPQSVMIFGRCRCMASNSKL